MKAGDISEDLAWWRAHRGAGAASNAELRALLERLEAWRVQHDADRAGQPPPFLRMVWDAIFGDEAATVAEAISQIEAALAEA